MGFLYDYFGIDPFGISRKAEQKRMDDFINRLKQHGKTINNNTRLVSYNDPEWRQKMDRQNAEIDKAFERMKKEIY